MMIASVGRRLMINHGALKTGTEWKIVKNWSISSSLSWLSSGGIQLLKFFTGRKGKRLFMPSFIGSKRNNIFRYTFAHLSNYCCYTDKLKLKRLFSETPKRMELNDFFQDPDEKINQNFSSFVVYEINATDFENRQRMLKVTIYGSAIFWMGSVSALYFYKFDLLWVSLGGLFGASDIFMMTLLKPSEKSKGAQLVGKLTLDADLRSIQIETNNKENFKGMISDIETYLFYPLNDQKGIKIGCGFEFSVPTVNSFALGTNDDYTTGSKTDKSKRTALYLMIRDNDSVIINENFPLLKGILAGDMNAVHKFKFEGLNTI